MSTSVISRLILLSAYLGSFWFSTPICAGGRECVGREHLQNLDPKHIPPDLGPSPSIPEVIAAFDIGDRPVTAVEFIGDGERLVVAESGPLRRGAGPAGRVMIYDLTGEVPRKL